MKKIIFFIFGCFFGYTVYSLYRTSRVTATASKVALVSEKAKSYPNYDSENIEVLLRYAARDFTHSGQSGSQFHIKETESGRIVYSDIMRSGFSLRFVVIYANIASGNVEIIPEEQFALLK